MTRFALPLALLLFVAACATTPPPPSNAPAIMPQTALDLGGDWRRSSIASVARRFSEEVAQRYRAGATIPASVDDLARNQFRCAANTDMRGDPPAQVCAKTETVANCTHTWRVMLYAQAGATVERARGLYDRRCGGEGLLGGP